MSFTITQPSATKEVNKWNTMWANKLPTQETAPITPTIVSPGEERTPSAFGGTAGASRLPVNKSKEKSTNILNDKTLFSFSDYNTVMLQKEQNKLNNLNKKANQYLLQEANNKRFFHLPLSEIINNTVLTVVAIFIDLLHLMKPEEQKKIKDMNFQNKAKVYANVIIQKDRMVYFGVFLIFLSLLFMVIFLSS